MKLIVFAVLAVASFVAVPPPSVCQEKPAEQQLHWYASMPLGKTVHLAARSIERDAPTLTWRPSVVRLAGDVVIRMRVEGAAGGITSYMILHADQAVYHEDTGTIDAQGNVRVTFEPAK